MKRRVGQRLQALTEEYRLPPGSAERLERLLAALAAEPDPQTSVADPAAAVDHHVADSLSALRLDAVRAATTIVDIGAGAGFPGLPLAVALPCASVDLVEAVRRKSAVIGRLASAAGLANAQVVTARAEEWGAGVGRQRYDVATARALGPLAVILEYAAPLLRVGGTLVAWKGARNGAEEAAGQKAASVLGLSPAGVLPVTPFPSARALHLHLYLKERATPDRFPRRPGVAAKRPLS